MADDVNLASPSGTAAADDVGGKLYQKIKLGWGADGTFNEVDDATGKRVPVIIDSSQIGALATTSYAMSTGYTLVGLPTDQVWASAARVGTMTFAAANAAYLANDIIGAAASCTSMGRASSSVMITSATLIIPDATAQATAWRLHLFNVTPPSALADNAAFALASGDRASYLGFIDLGTAADAVDTQYCEVNGINKQIRLGATPSIFAYLVPLTGLTPAASTMSVTLHTVEV